MVTKEELLELVWPGLVVEENNLQVQVSALRKLLGPQLIATIPGRGYRFTADLQGEGPAMANAAKSPEMRAATPLQSVAVVPFANASGDERIEYLSDGLAENIILRLSQIPELRVLAFSMVARHKRPDVDAQKIGRKLGVGAVVTGRVLQHDETLSVSAELIDVNNGWQLWGGQYRRKSQDILAVEEEIARDIAQKLLLKLAPDKPSQLARPPTDNVEAYHLYLKGRFHWGKRTAQDLFQALEYFRGAIEKDPIYAYAYAGLAEGYVPLAFYGHLPPRDAYPKAKAAAERALEILPDLSHARSVVGTVRLRYEWDWANAERELRAAVAHDPDYPRARQSLAECLSLKGERSEAIDQVRRALDLDPLSLHMNAAVVMTHHFCGGSNEAIEFGRKAIALEPGFFPTHFYLGLAYQQVGRFSEAIAELRQATALSANSSLMGAALACALAGSGAAREARGILGELLCAAAPKYVSQTFVAAIHEALGDRDSALAGLEKAFDERCPWLPQALTCDPRFADLRRDVRCQSLVERMALAR